MVPGPIGVFQTDWRLAAPIIRGQGKKHTAFQNFLGHTVFEDCDATRRPWGLLRSEFRLGITVTLSKGGIFCPFRPPLKGGVAPATSRQAEDSR